MIAKKYKDLKIDKWILRGDEMAKTQKRQRTVTAYKKQADAMLEKAKILGIEEDYPFITRFEAYKTQVNILRTLEKTMKEIGPTVEKEYVKGRKNVCINPAISEYNKTCTAANSTIKTLKDIYPELFKIEEGEDAFLTFISDGEAT